jgi:hypothetical protein
VVPVPAVAREARRLEAEHRAYDAFADLPDESSKPWTIAGSARRHPEIGVDHTHVAEALSARQISELVLLALALEVLRDLHAR